MSISPSTVIAEGENFQITVNSNNVPLDQVTISFAGQTYTTGSNGAVSITAPPVEKKTSYLLVASHAGYDSISTAITILDTSSSSVGFIYGVVSSTDSSLLANVQISISLSGGGTKQTLSDSDGKYVLSAPPGSYTVEVKKVGYKTKNMPSLVIVERQAKENNVVLEKEQGTTSASGQNTDVVNYIITQEISKGTIGAQVAVAPQQAPQISYYADELTVDVTSGNEKVFCTVNAPDGTGAMIMVIHIARGVLPDISNLKIVVDNTQIERETDVEAFFDLSDSTSGSQSSWLQFSSEGDTYALIKITHFSTHSITITSIVETISGLLAYSLYIIISAVILAVFFSPMLLNIIRRRRSL